MTKIKEKWTWETNEGDKRVARDGTTLRDKVLQYKLEQKKFRVGICVECKKDKCSSARVIPDRGWRSCSQYEE